MEKYSSAFQQYLLEHKMNHKLTTLYEPINYLIDIGGKRVRPALVLMSYDLFKKDINYAMPIALMVEYFHNFTLMHDDIMDHANLRRGKKTVHEKYDVNTAILSGDALLIKAYELLENYQADLCKSLLLQFNKMAIEVCEGQRMDIDFETREHVKIEEYLKMIEYKTSVLLAASLSMGATLAQAPDFYLKHLYEFGKNIGIAFQIQDDILDAFGDETKVGKKQGGDIIQNKKTYLYLKALELSGETKSEIYQLYHNTEIEESTKVERAKHIFYVTGALEHAKQVKDAYRDLAISHIQSMQLDIDKAKMLTDFADFLVKREE